MNRSTGAAPRKRGEPRTRLDDIEAVGFELSEEHLRLVVGGMEQKTCMGSITNQEGGCHDDVEDTIRPITK